MKRLIQGILVGVIISFLLMSNISVFADSINVLFNVVNIKINGNQIAKVGDNYTLENGNQVPFSISYMGTTYLPMRKLAELLDKEVVWEQETKTACVNDKVISSIIPSPTPLPMPTPITTGMTREQLARFLVQSFDLKSDKTTIDADDVTVDNEYYPDIVTVYNCDVMSKVSLDKWGPKLPITRAMYAFYLLQACKINHWDYTDIDIGIKINDIKEAKTTMHKNAIKAVISLGIMELDEKGNFYPNAPMEVPQSPDKSLQQYINK